MILDYIYYSGLVTEAEGVTFIIGYYRDSSEAERNKGIVYDRLLQRLDKLYVLASHFHPDHFNQEILTWKEQCPDIIYTLSEDILKHHRIQSGDTIYINRSEEYEDDTLRIQTFSSTDVSISFLVHLQGKSIFHAGDLNNWYWSKEFTEQKVHKAEGGFLAEVKFLRESVPAVGLVMFPVDHRMGRDYMKGAQQSIERVKATIFAPMHLGEDYEGGNAFRSIAEADGCHFITIAHRGESFEV